MSLEISSVSEAARQCLLTRTEPEELAKRQNSPVTMQTRPMKDEELLGVSIPVSLVSELRDLVDEMKQDLQAVRRERRRSEQLLAGLVELFTHLEDDGLRRSALQKMSLQLFRREAEYSLPSYFWRPDKERTTEQMLRDRARYLIYEARAGVHDIWSFLVEFNDEYSGNPVTNAAIEQIIREEKRAPTAA